MCIKCLEITRHVYTLRLITFKDTYPTHITNKGKDDVAFSF